MVFSSVPVCLDPPNWQQQLNHHQVAASENPHLQPLRAPPNHHVGAGGVGSIRAGSMADRARLANVPQPEAPLKCPRCESTNTKFCYFNNYSLTQPRHFCKTCLRYWTRGGALRNVPVGGSGRRNKKKKSSTSSSKPTASNSERQSGPISTNAVIPSEITAHLMHQSPHLPFMASLPSFSQYGIGNIGVNYGGIQGQIGRTSGASGQADTGFHIGTNSDMSNAILSVGSVNRQQFSLFEPTNSLYPLQTDYMEASPSMVGETQLFRSTSTSSSSRVSQRAAVKMENNSEGLNLSRSLLGISDQNYNQYWGGNTWTDLSGLK